jgi:hypothetical protein
LTAARPSDYSCHVKSALSLLGLVGAGALTGCAGDAVIRTAARSSSFDGILARAQPLECKVALLDREFPLLILDCPEGRIAFGPDSGTPRTSEIVRGAAAHDLEANCFHGMEPRCQEFAERLLGQPVTSPERRVPKAPNPLVRPAGSGWHCLTFEVSGLTLPDCVRDEAECARRYEMHIKRDDRPTRCVRVPRAACNTGGRGHGNWTCAATMAECEKDRRERDSPCELWD